VGQELTIRTLHVGVTRKRVVPVLLFKHPVEIMDGKVPDSLEEFNHPFEEKDKHDPTRDVYLYADDNANAKPVGKLLGVSNCLGIAQLRLNHVFAPGKNIFYVHKSSDDLKEGSRIYIKGEKPDFWPERMEY
jgi:folate-binding Fe-S cluster repair protein YgfZ